MTSRSRKFETWTWRDPETGERVEVECRAVKTRSAHGTETTSFEVRLPKYDVHESDKDPNALRDRVFHEIAARRSVAWSYHLHVFAGGDFSSFHGSDNFTAEGFDYVGIQGSLRVDVSPVQVGLRSDGEHAWNRTGGCGVNAHAGRPHVGKGSQSSFGSGDRTTGVWALVPDTPENRKALATVVGEMQKLKDRLQTFLSPGNIDLVLEQVNKAGGTLSLPSPQQEEPGADGRA